MGTRRRADRGTVTTTNAITSSVTATLAALISDTRSGDLPDAVRDAARRSVLDTIGVALAGAHEDSVRILRDVALGRDDRTGTATRDGAATIIGAAGCWHALDAALINGTTAHALDYDDTHQSIRGHPSASIVPAALAAAETVGASGARLVDAYALGLEVAGRVGRGIGSSHAAHGFHSSSTLGVIGAAAAAARVFGLDRAQVVAALGIAASSAAGLRLNFGYMAKPLHAGNAARGGLLAATLAQRGFSATDVAFDGSRGFIGTYSPDDGDPDAPAIDDGTWQAITPGIAVKKYPCCNRGHRAADAVLALLATHKFTAAEVASIEVHMPAGEVDAAGRVGPMVYPRPVTGLQAKFSMPYVMATAVLDSGLRAAAFRDDAVRRPEAADLAERVHPVADEDRPPSDAELNFVRVVVRLRDGRSLTEQVRFPRGDPRGGVPLTDDELAAKFRDCASAVIPDEPALRALRMLERLDEVEDVRALTALLTAS